MEKQFTGNKGICFTPIYIPGETYAFVINSEPITDPDFDSFRLRLYNAAGQMVHNDFSNLMRCYWFDFNVSAPLVNPYQIYCRLVFPSVPIGQYYFTIHDEIKDVEKVRSNAIICETHLIERTALLEYRDNTSKFYYNYNTNFALPDTFYSIFRLPLTLEELQYESDRSQYRNATDNRFRNIRSQRATMKRIQAINFDNEGHEALSAVLEHSDIRIDGKDITVKSALTITGNPATELTRSSFEAYYDNEETSEDDLYSYGPVIFCGDHIFNPIKIIDANI